MQYSACISPNTTQQTEKSQNPSKKGSNKRIEKNPAPLAAANNQQNQELTCSRSRKKFPITSLGSQQKISTASKQKPT